MTISPKYLSLLVGLWEQLFKIGVLISRLKLSRDSGFSSKIETITPNSVRLDTLQGSRVWGGGGESRGILPRKKLGIWGFQTAGNALKLSILASPCYFCIILNILRSHQADLFGSWGGGGGGWQPWYNNKQRPIITDGWVIRIRYSPTQACIQWLYVSDTI